MRLMWLPGGWEDYLWWQENDRKGLARVNESDADAASEFAAACDEAGLAEAAATFRAHAVRVAEAGGPAVAPRAEPQFR